jgi:hypothetical protein
MSDRRYGHLARDGREHAIELLDAHDQPRRNARRRHGARRVDVDEALRRRVGNGNRL